jgi:hypothetical protein
MKEESLLSCTMTFQEPLKSKHSWKEKKGLNVLVVLEHCVLERKDLDTRDVYSIESFQISCYKEEISPEEMELEENQFMVKLLMMRTLFINMSSLDCSPWPIVVQTPMDLNSLSPLLKLHGWMECMLSLEKLLKVWMSSEKLRSMALKKETLLPELSFPIAVFFNDTRISSLPFSPKLFVASTGI